MKSSFVKSENKHMDCIKLKTEGVGNISVAQVDVTWSQIIPSCLAHYILPVLRYENVAFKIVVTSSLVHHLSRCKTCKKSNFS